MAGLSAPPDTEFEAAVLSAIEASAALPAEPAYDRLGAASAEPTTPGNALSPDEVQQVLDMAQAAMATAQEEAEAAQDAAAKLALRLSLAEEEREAVAARLAQLESSAAAKDAEAHAAEAAAAELLARMTAQLEGMRAEVAAAEASALAAANLAEASAAAATALLEANAAASAAAPTPLATEKLFGPHPKAVLADLEAARMLPGQLPFLYTNTSLAAPGHPSRVAVEPGTVPGVPTLSPVALLLAAAAAMGIAALAVVLHLRGRRRLAAEAARSAALAARLKEAAFAKDTAEQSLGMLERELQRRMKQLEDVQQAAAEAGGSAGGCARVAQGWTQPAGLTRAHPRPPP